MKRQWDQIKLCNTCRFGPGIGVLFDHEPARENNIGECWICHELGVRPFVPVTGEMLSKAVRIILGAIETRSPR